MSAKNQRNSRRSTSISTKDKILQGAAEIMQDLGIRKTRVQDILDSANVSRRTFYQYFKSTDELLLELYKEATTKLTTSVMQAMITSKEPGEKLSSGVKAYLDFQQSGGHLLILLQAEAIRPDSSLSEYRKQVLDVLVAMLDQTISRLFNISHDPYFYWAAMVGVEGLVIHVQRNDSFSETERARVEKVIMRLLSSLFAPKS